MPSYSEINSKLVVVAVNAGEQVLARRGAMLAYTGTRALSRRSRPARASADSSAAHFIEPPVRVDPQAVVGWSDCPSPCHHYDAAYMKGVIGAAQAFMGLGPSSGEEHQFDFTGAGTS
jgi:hypothetical protein